MSSQDLIIRTHLHLIIQLENQLCIHFDNEFRSRITTFWTWLQGES